MNPRISQSTDKLIISGSGIAELLGSVTAKGQSLKFKVKGFSMAPFIKDGDLVVISPVTDKRPGLGDVAACPDKITGKLVIHRIVGLIAGKNRLYYRIKGDNGLQEDSPAAFDDIIGYVSSLERNKKKVLLGFGPEKWIIALLSRHCLLRGLVRWIKNTFK